MVLAWFLLKGIWKETSLDVSIYRCASWFQGLFRVIDSEAQDTAARCRWLGWVVRIRVWWVSFLPMRRSMGFFPLPSSAFIDGRLLNFKSWHPWVPIGLYWLFLRMLFFYLHTQIYPWLISTCFVCLWKRKRLQLYSFHNVLFVRVLSEFMKNCTVNFVLWTVNSSATFFGCFFS